MIVVMGKVPRAGEVKTRLAPPHLAVEMYRAFLADTFDLAGGGVFACAARDLEEAGGLAPPGWRTILQRGKDLGDRIAAAQADAGGGPVVIIGSDAPMMPRERISQAFEALKTHRAVFGPASDGGYYLIGMTGPCPELLRDIPWSTDQVMSATRARAKEAGIAIAELEPGYDLDEPADLIRALADLRLPPKSRAAILAAVDNKEIKLSAYALSGG